MEITDVSLQAPTVNNLWSYNDAKSVLKLSLSAYNFKSADETKDIQFTDEMNSIDDFFLFIIANTNTLKGLSRATVGADLRFSICS